MGILGVVFLFLPTAQVSIADGGLQFPAFLQDLIVHLWLFCVYIIMGGLQLPAFLQALIVHLLIALSIYLWVDYNSQEAKQLPHISVYFYITGRDAGKCSPDPTHSSGWLACTQDCI